MSVQEIREQFESTLKARWPNNHLLLLRVNQPGTPADGDYENPTVHHMWWAWQTSRETVEVKLPLATDGQMWVSQVVDSITAQGLKVAG